MAPTLQDARLLSALYGVSEKSLWLYENLGLLRPVLIEGVRYYTPRDRVRLEIVLKGRRLGFSLAEIEKLVFGAARPPAEPSEARQPDLSSIIDELRRLAGRRDHLAASIDALKARLDVPSTKPGIVTTKSTRD